MKWLQSTGGPLVLMAQDLLPHWRGCDGDYDRACGVCDWLGVLDVGDGQALVLGDEPMQTAGWFQAPCWLLVRWSCAPDEATVVRHLERVNQLKFPATGTEVDFGSRLAVLFDSSACASDLRDDEVLRLELPASKCVVRTLDWRADNDTRLILHSFQPAI